MTVTAESTLMEKPDLCFVVIELYLFLFRRMKQKGCSYEKLSEQTEHYFPWGMLLQRKLPRLAAYILGVIALAAPLSALYGFWLTDPAPVAEHFYLAALWAVIGAGGAAVIICHLLDFILERLALARELSELIRVREERDARADR